MTRTERADNPDTSRKDPDSDAGRGVPDPATIAIERCSLSFGDLPVLEDVSLSIEPGEFVGLVGPNGAGKTTLLRTISGVLEPASGTVMVDGVDVHDVSSRRSSQLVSVVPQDTALSFSFPVRDVVEMGRHPHRSRFSPPTVDDRKAVEHALERTRTAKFANRPIDEVSGGQRQRVIIARAIAQETPALLLDEPTASLDIAHQVETLELVRELVDDGRTVVAAIHDLDLAARYCDRLVLLADGEIRRDGVPSTVLTSETLADSFDANAVVAPNPVTGSETVTALADARDTDSLPKRVHVLGTGAAAAGVVARLDAAGIEVTLGPVSSGDGAAETARSLGVEAIEVEPFARLSTDVRTTAERRVREADVTVLADHVLGAGNQTILDALEESDALAVVETRPLADRNFAGTAARKRYSACRERAVETSPQSILAAIREASARQQRSQSAESADPPTE
ncbi:ATP-binding cassette domain-containing protein [Natrinema halophilum]|uniref:Cobalamin import ATP-binding protein BtuD n=1 Tax=Natrinema halophilum TaxID=1699371 RepID=A0A7D5KYU7_9EURY|nr:ATP-binding cassette domain-containing protein [Natrinema halophilum]QLG47720.1 ATP-binding cassette domain-containing protein [Natrinema halophilum]